MNKLISKSVLVALGVGVMTPHAVMATNGMNLEGYGPIALGMGGASMAYDNGTAAVMNNPATLGLMADGTSRIDAALGFLGPNIDTTVSPSAGGSGTAASSSADAFYMPAVGWAKRQGQMTYGVGMFAQGGMGTEYSATSDLALASGDKVMSQLGVMRIVAPLSFNVDEKLTVGGSIDFVRASMDLKMAVTTAQLSGLVSGASTAWSSALPGLATLDWGRFDFADGSDYTGASTGDGFAFKLGAVYKVNKKMTVGATYHSETSLDDLEGDATLSAGTYGGSAAASFDGKIAVRNFQWPSTIALGAAFQASDNVMVAADVKRINWSDVMENFKMTFTESSMGELDVTLPQNWEDQTVVQLGASVKQNDKLTWRFGANIADNPIPDAYVNPLFPAIVEKHYTAGVGYDVSDNQAVNFALSYAPEVAVTSSAGYTIEHSQTSWQIMYSHNL